MTIGVELVPTLVFQILFFFSFVCVGIILIYLGRELDASRKVHFTWVILAAGIVVSNLDQLFSVMYELENISLGALFLLNTISTVAGLIIIALSFILMFTKKLYEAERLSKRAEEIRDTIKNLSEKWRGRQISEEDLRLLTSHLIGELAEIEVRLKNLDKLKKIKIKNAEKSTSS